MTDVKKILEPAFCVALYEMEKLIKEGYSLSQQNEPIYIAGLYEIELVKDEKALDKVVFTEKQEEKLKEAEVAGFIVPIVDGEVTEEIVEKAVEAATSTPKRGRKATPKAE